MNKLFKYLKGYWLVTILAPLFMILEVWMDLQQPSLMAQIIDVGITNGDIDYILAIGGKMLLFTFIGVIGGVACTYFSSRAGMGMGTNLRKAMFQKVQTFAFAEIDRHKPSTIITRMTNDVTQIQQMVMMALRMVVRAPMFTFGGLIMAYTISPKLSLIFVAAAPILLFTAIFVMKRAFPLFEKMQKKIDAINSVMREGLLGVRVIKAFNGEERERERFGRANQELKDQGMEAMGTVMIMMPVITLVMNLSLVALFWFGGVLTISGELTTGAIMSFMNYLMQVLGSLMMLAMIAVNFSRAKASAERINEILDTDTSIKPPEHPAVAQGFDVEFENVSFGYNPSSPEYVLKDINFSAKEGQTIGIIGGTGSGKSTFVSLIPRLYDATEGSVKIGGRDVRELSIDELRSKIGVVLQESVLFSGTVEDNLRWGDDDATKQQMDAAVEDAQAANFLFNTKEGYDSPVEQRGRNFSGGQKQRLSIARTFVKDPEILILDDSTSAVDMATEAKLHDALKKRRDDRIVFIIAQRISAISDADNIIVLDDGRISAQGTHEELLKNSEIYRSIAVSQMGEEVLVNAG
ncbi:MAG: ABC transporter ATP-binding protein [Christensenellales bacterium]|jgi:ATP-binding cassette subfamily B multidrug efflux pump